MNSADLSGLFVCPYCHRKLAGDKTNNFQCLTCGNEYGICDGIYRFFNDEDAGWIETAAMVKQSTRNATFNGREPGWPYIFFDGSVVRVDIGVSAALLNIIFEFLHDILIDERDRVLMEIGLWDGWAAYVLSRYQPVIGIDACETILRCVKADYGRGITRVVADAKSLPLPSQSVDAIYMIATYHHMVNYAEALNEWWRVLKYGGKLIAVGEIYVSDADLSGENADRLKLNGEWGYTYEQMCEAFDESRFGFIHYTSVLHQDYMQYMLSDSLIKYGETSNGMIIAQK